MKRAMKIAVGAAATLLALTAVIYALGAMQPVRHTASVERVVAMPIETAAAHIRDVADYPRWRKVKVEMKASDGDGAAYVEEADGDRIAYRLTEPSAGRQFVATITDPSLPFGGAWTYDLSPEGEGTRVRIREDGEVRDPVYRFFARFVFGQTGSMNAWLDALEADADR